MFSQPVQITGIFGVNRFQPAAVPSPLPAAWHHPYHELICVVCGRFHVAGKEEERIASPGDVFFYPAGVKHAEWRDMNAPAAKALWIGFYGTINAKPAEKIVVLRDPRGRIVELTNWMVEDAVAGRATSDPHMHALLAAVLGEVEQALTDSAAPPPWVMQIHNHIHDHLTDPLSVAVLASIAGLSPYHFIRAYRKATGRTPMADVRAIRIQHARQMLHDTAFPLKEVAAQSGLGDAYALDRIFRHCLGMAPGQFRRTKRA